MVAVTGYPAGLILNKLLGLNCSRSLMVWLVVAWPINIPGLRGLTSTFFPSAVIHGDDAAAARLGGRVYLPTNEFWIRGFWWVDATPIRGAWSDEQMKVRERIFAIALCIFVPAFLMLARALTVNGLSMRMSALIAFVLTMPCALYAGRRISIRRWPDLVGKADDDAVKLDNRSVPPRT